MALRVRRSERQHLGLFFSRLTAGHLPTDALRTVAWVALIQLAITFMLAFRLPMQAREGEQS
jgi:hypothetical protein